MKILNYKPFEILKWHYALLLLLIIQVKIAYTQQDVWKCHTIDNSGSGADGVRLGDANKDGLMDIVVGWEESGYTKTYFHPGYEKVTQKWGSVVVGKTPKAEDAVFGDLDNDGFFDIITCSEGFTQHIAIHWSPQSLDSIIYPNAWKQTILPQSEKKMKWMYASITDLNKDGRMDIVAGGKGIKAQIGWFEAPENPRDFRGWQWHPLEKVKWIMSVETIDLDDDKKADIVYSDRKGKSSGVYCLRDKGKKYPWERTLLADKGKRVMFLDANITDLTRYMYTIEYTNQTVHILEINEQDTFRYSLSLPLWAGRAKAVKVGDINGDTIPDIVCSTNTLKKRSKHGIFWLSGLDAKANNLDWKSISGLEGYKFDRIELLDMDGDKDLDVLTTEENFGKGSRGLGVIWYENPYF